MATASTNGRAPWIIRLPAAFIDARTAPRAKGKPLPVRLRLLTLILEGYARDKPFCWVGNRELAEAYGCGERALQLLLRELEAAGIIRCVATETGRMGRIGIAFLIRANPDLPTADPDEINDLAELLRAQKIAPTGPGNGASGRKKVRAEGAKNCAHPRAQKIAPGIRTKSLSLNNDEVNQEQKISAPQRQRPEITPPPAPQRPERVYLTGAAEKYRRRPRPEPIAPEGPPTAAEQIRGIRERLERQRAAAESGEPMPPTPGQLAWLETLAPDRRARFDSLTPGTQASLLGPHTDGVNPDPILGAEAARILASRQEPPPAIPVPETTAEILEKLPGAPPGWAQIAAESIVRDFGTERDRKLWPGFQQVMTAVWNGSFPRSAVEDAYRQGMKGKNRGAVFNTVLKRDHGWRWSDG